MTTFATPVRRPGLTLTSSGKPAFSRAQRFQTLLFIYDGLLGSDLEHARTVAHPSMTALKWELEQSWLRELPAEDSAPTSAQAVVDQMRHLAARNRIPTAYTWVARHADLKQLRDFLAAEGGPDGGFDDLVAVAQLGLSGQPKLEMAVNYWDELGNGHLDHIHTELHRDTTRILDLRPPATEVMSEKALERAALGGLLATNHWLQPEMIGGLGMIELQAGPRCQMVLKAMQRLDVPDAAQTFYRVHAEVDPRHGADWLANVVAPVCEASPDWGARILRGALWRLGVNDAFLSEVAESLAGTGLAA